jgi:methyl-accepting chemotaxis protein
MLAVNARIEAARAGAAGGAFGVVANEIGSLSKSTKSMSESMSEDLGQIVAAIDEIRTIVQLVAKVDLSANIELKRSLDSLVEALVKRNGDVGQIVSDAAIDQQLISSQIDQIVTSMQFQDRVAQRLEQVVDTLVVVGDAVEELHQETADATSAEPLEQTPHDIAWLKGLSARYKLSAMRARFVARVIDGNLPDAADCVASDNPSEAGSIELF